MFSLFLSVFPAKISSAQTSKERVFVRVSPRDPHYLELSDGSPFIPIGLNLIGPHGSTTAEGLACMEDWMKKLSRNRGNFIRIWLSHNFWDIEHEKCGVYDEEKARRIDRLLDLARRYNIRLKLTLEHFRSIGGGPQKWADKSLHHLDRGGTAESVTDFFSGSRSREQFKKKLGWYTARYGSDPIVFGWELWNEVNAVRGSGWLEWSEIMLGELHRRFSRNLALQSLGSFDTDRKRDTYRRMMVLKPNDIAQVHRYLDLGASLEICHGPADLLTADAVRELLAFDVKKPILLAESGAVEPGHSGPFKLYQKDTAGIILHDVLFAPFFAGAAGPGQIWHWDHYVDKMNLWHHFDRFAEAVKDLDPPVEHFQLREIPHPRLRILVLEGRHTFLAWCRDRENTWRTELVEATPPRRIQNMALSLKLLGLKDSSGTCRVYDPWTNRWTSLSPKREAIILPDFTRSLVIHRRR